MGYPGTHEGRPTDGASLPPAHDETEIAVFGRPRQALVDESRFVAKREERAAGGDLREQPRTRPKACWSEFIRGAEPKGPIA
jgi:hypothetical protein